MKKKTHGLRYEPLYKPREQRQQAKGWVAFWRRVTFGLFKGRQ